MKMCYTNGRRMWHVEYRCAARNQKAETSDSRHPAEIPFQRIRITHGPVAVNIPGRYYAPRRQVPTDNRPYRPHRATDQRLRKRQFACRAVPGDVDIRPASDRPRNSRPKPPSGGKPPCSREAGSTMPPDDRACPPTTIRHPYRPEIGHRRPHTPPSGQPSCPVKEAPPSGRATPPARYHRPPHPERKRYRPYRQKAAPYHMYRYRSSPQMRRTPLSSVRAGSPGGEIRLHRDRPRTVAVRSIKRKSTLPEPNGQYLLHRTGTIPSYPHRWSHWSSNPP